MIKPRQSDGKKERMNNLPGEPGQQGAPALFIVTIFRAVSKTMPR